MEAPPREKRARAAFFREKDAKRAAKQQRKKEKLAEKLLRGTTQDGRELARGGSLPSPSAACGDMRVACTGRQGA